MMLLYYFRNYHRILDPALLEACHQNQSFRRTKQELSAVMDTQLRLQLREHRLAGHTTIRHPQVVSTSFRGLHQNHLDAKARVIAQPLDLLRNSRQLVKDQRYWLNVLMKSIRRWMKHKSAYSKNIFITFLILLS